MTGDEYMTLLERRQSHWLAAHPDSDMRFPPLLEWFVRDGDETFVQLPEATARPTRRPRNYRPACELIAERDQLATQLTDIMFDTDAPDRAAANIANPSRWKALDASIVRAAKLQHRVNRLDGRIASSQARERTSGAIG